MLLFFIVNEIRFKRERKVKYLKQFGIIMLISLIGEFLHFLIPLPVPASIYGLVLMLAALISGMVKLESVRETAVFLIEIMPVMFIPAAVGLIDIWDLIRTNLVAYVILTFVSTCVVMFVAGRVTQAVIRRSGKGEKHG